MPKGDVGPARLTAVAHSGVEDCGIGVLGVDRSYGKLSYVQVSSDFECRYSGSEGEYNCVGTTCGDRLGPDGDELLETGSRYLQNKSLEGIDTRS